MTFSKETKTERLQAGAYKGAHRLREQGAEGSNPLAPTIHNEHLGHSDRGGFRVSGPRPVLPVVIAAVLQAPSSMPYMAPV